MQVSLPFLISNNLKRIKMKIFRKTYGVRNLVEWQAIIPAGRGKLIVHFTGGSITAYGVTPATYKTENPAQQAIIETSKHFRSGRIFLVKSELVKEIPDKTKPAAAPAASAAPVTPAAPAVTPVAEEPVVTEQVADTEPVEGAVQDNAPAAEETPSTEEGDGAKVNDDKRKEFACLEDAKQFLINTYGYTASAVRYKKNVKQMAEANGLTIVIEGVEL